MRKVKEKERGAAGQAMTESCKTDQVLAQRQHVRPASPRLEDVVGTSVGPARRVSVGSPGILAHCQPGTFAPYHSRTALGPDHLMERSRLGEGEGEHQEDNSGWWEFEKVRWIGHRRSHHLEWSAAAPLQLFVDCLPPSCEPSILFVSL